jgi:rhodanese-related sulfurtransferase
MLSYITPIEAKVFFKNENEFAVLDVREQEEFSRSHMLLASCTPLGRLELMVPALVPCKKIPIILVDSGDERFSSRAERAGEVLQRLGYADLKVLKGGMRAWRESGHIDFTGVGTLSKGFGEYVENVLGTPSLEPFEVRAIMDSGESCIVVDVRPYEEFTAMNIPGSINAPGCEAAYRVADLVPDQETLVIINCAGRTRSIIGTQTLHNAGVPNRIVALKGGTMNWQLAGFPLEYGARRRTAPPSFKALALARERAEIIIGKYGIDFVALATLLQWQADQENSTLYIFDVRQPEEFSSGHMPGSRNAPGGQLVQATDEYAAVRNARYVLVDDTEARAVMTAHWLKQMGLPHVYVLKGGLGGSGFGAIGLVQGEDMPLLPELPDVPRIGAEEVNKKISAGEKMLLINVGSSKTHRLGHVPGSVWVTRGYLDHAVHVYPQPTEIVIVSDDDAHARLAVGDAADLWQKAMVFALDGGLQAWRDAGLPLEEGMQQALCAEDDIWYRPYTDVKADAEAMKGYFDWEFGLVERIRMDGTVEFALGPVNTAC